MWHDACGVNNVAVAVHKTRRSFWGPIGQEGTIWTSLVYLTCTRRSPSHDLDLERRVGVVTFHHVLVASES